MTTLIEASGQNASVQAMWALVAVLVIVALWLSVRVIRRARRESCVLDDRVAVVVADGDRVMAKLAHPWSDPEHDVMADLQAYSQPPVPADWLTTDQILAEVTEFQNDFHRHYLNQLAVENCVIGFDREGTVVYQSDLWDGNIDLSEVFLRHWRARYDVALPDWTR